MAVGARVTDVETAVAEREEGRTAGEIEVYSEDVADMFCAYLKQIS